MLGIFHSELENVAAPGHKVTCSFRDQPQDLVNPAFIVASRG